jgi:Holliday junction resolvase-like predicted endonuclease
MTQTDTVRVGDEVEVLHGARLVKAEVLEDRGPVGPRGERFLRVGWRPADTAERLEFEVPASRVVARGASQELLVRQILSSAGFRVEQPDRSQFPDFIAKSGGRTVIVEVKAFPGGAAPRKVSEVETRLLRALPEFRASEALLVVPHWDRFLTRRDRRPGVAVVPVGELEGWAREWVDKASSASE